MGTSRNRLAVLFAMSLTVAVMAQSGEPTPAPLPADLRAALRALPLQPPASDGVTVLVVDDADGSVLRDAMVLVMDDSKWAAARQQQPMERSDLERGMAAPLLLAGSRYATDATGRVVVPRGEQHVTAYAMTDRAFGFAVWRAKDGAAPSLELRVQPSRRFTARVTDGAGKPVRGVPVEFGMYGEGGFDRFEPMLAEASGADGSVQFVMPGQMVRMLEGPKGGSLAAQVSVLGGAPVRRTSAEAKDGVLELVLPPVGKAVVRLYGAHERPRGGLTSVLVRAVGEQPSRPPVPHLSARQPQRQTSEAAEFDFVALGKQLLVQVSGEGIAGQLEHTQAGPQRAGELVVLTVRIVDSSPAIGAKLVDTEGAPVANEPVSVLFQLPRGLLQAIDVVTGADGRLLVPVPEPLRGQQARLLVWRRPQAANADTVYGGAVTIDLAADVQGLKDLGELRLLAEPVLLAGRLVDPSGAPLAGVVVSMAPTQAGDRADRLPFALQDYKQLARVLHRATTDHEGRFTFRELLPARRTGALEVADGAWVTPFGTRWTPGADEQRIEVQQPGQLHITFANKPPIGVEIELVAKAHTVRLHAAEAARAGVLQVPQVPPGRYDLRVRVHDHAAMVIDGIDVLPGAVCADARLLAVDWAAGLRVATLRLLAPDGQLVAAQYTVRDDRDRQLTSGSVEGDTTLVLPAAAKTIAFHRDSYRTVAVEAKAAIEVRFTLRPLVRVTLPAGLTLPSGLGLRVPALGGTPSYAVWNGTTAMLRVDGEGEVRVEIGNGSWLERETVPVWSGVIQVNAEAEQSVVLPLTKDAVEAIRAELRVK